MMIAEMETVNMQTWRATEHHVVAGWHLRLSGGYSRRGNSVFTHEYDSNASIEETIGQCESIYNAQDLPVIIRTTTATQAPDLERHLEQGGYTKEGPSIVMTVDLLAELAPAHSDFTVSTRFEDDWLRDYMHWNNIDPHLYESHKGIVSAMPDCYYGRIGDCALGLAVKAGEWVSFYDIVVNPQKRGQGYGRLIMQSLLEQSRSAGAIQGILSVGSENAPAIALYRDLNFEERYNYWYYRQAYTK